MKSEEFYLENILGATRNDELKTIEEIPISTLSEILKNEQSSKTLATHCASYGRTSIAKFLYSKGLNFKFKDDKNGQTPLHYAVGSGEYSMVEFLVDIGLDVNEKTSYGLTPLHIAVDRDNKKIVDLLLRRGARVDAVDFEGKTPLHIACINNFRRIAEILLKRGADINARDFQGWTPLHYAFYYNSSDVALPLISKGADSKNRDNSGMTPLHLACMRDNVDVIMATIKDVKDLGVMDGKGTPAIVLADIYRSTKVLDFVKSFEGGESLLSDAKIFYHMVRVFSGIQGTVRKITNPLGIYDSGSESTKSGIENSNIVDHLKETFTISESIKLDNGFRLTRISRRPNYIL
ncbi:MAG: ankyrin repeat domain-containing protein [Brevinematales bacterium]|nr:ankyrin repeat domain-containing protein [Brevinematales bacterium]